MDDSVKDWIEKKMDEGVSEDRIKKTLRETGRDPGLVDEVQSPFEDGEENDTEADTKPSSGQEENEGDEGGFDSLNFIDPEEEEDEEDSEESSEAPSSGQEEDDESSESSFSLPAVSIPSIHLGRKKLLLAVLLLLIIGIGYPGFSFFDGSSITDVSNPLGPSCTEGVGVKLYSAGVSNDMTMAEVYTDQEAEMVLEVFSGDKKMGEGTRTINGRGVIRVDAVGDRAVFHEKGCDEPFSETSY